MAEVAADDIQSDAKWIPDPALVHIFGILPESSPLRTHAFRVVSAIRGLMGEIEQAKPAGQRPVVVLVCELSADNLHVRVLVQYEAGESRLGLARRLLDAIVEAAHDNRYTLLMRLPPKVGRERDIEFDRNIERGTVRFSMNGAPGEIVRG